MMLPTLVKTDRTNPTIILFFLFRRVLCWEGLDVGLRLNSWAQYSFLSDIEANTKYKVLALKGENTTQNHLVLDGTNRTQKGGRGR
jgi:hypothetical protein